MSVSALQSKTMLQSISRKPVHHLELPAKHEQPKPQLPSKRKRDAICGLGAFNKPFTIHPSPESPYEKHYTFKPIRIIGRGQLPLTFLDTSNDEDSAATRLFIANIDVLEKHHDAHNNENESPKVLIARYEAKKTLYAIERVQSRLYSICKLAPWLREKDVAELWDPASLLLYPTFAKQENDGVSTRNWWQEASVELDQVERPVKCVRLAMLRPIPQAEVVSTMPEPHPNDQAVHEGKDANPEPPIIPPEFGLQLPSPQEQLETLVQQYLDAVYLSKTSLAYLAKGPITRIRNTFTSHEEGAPPTHELVTFLRSMLLSHKARDKKYQAKLPEVIKAIPMGCFSDAEPAETVNKPKKSKKKVKLNREGMYPQEEEIVKKWWLSELPSGEGYGEETADQRIKRRTGDLRVREALAQMILMLEIIALESLSTYKPALDGNEEVGNESQAQAETQQPKTKKRKKKMEDINLLLDLLLDLLCIWQSTDEIGIIDFDAKPSKQNVATDGSGKGRGNDRLQSFCIEVIIPFYMSRLPEQALMINKKLGGPANTSPPKRKAMKPPTSRKQGESKEPELKKSRRTLARVATDTAGMAGERTRPSLNRNATDPALLNSIKREGSEVPLSAIPFQRSPSKGVRQTMSQFKHLKGREIDLTTTSAAAAAKMKQKKRVEEDLKEAISALKKPNRGLAVGGYVDDIERRGLGLSNKSRKPANPVRKVVKDVQVSATPRAARRTKDFIEQTPNHHHNPFSRTHESGAPPSDFLIPSSGVRSASFIPGTVERGSTIRKSASHSVAETPSKVAIFKTVSPGAARRSIFETPSKDRPSTSLDKATIKASFIIDTPTKPSTFSPPSKFTDSPPGVFATPTKPAAAVADSPLALPTFSSTAKAKEDGEPSIYDALGWNDDDDLL